MTERKSKFLKTMAFMTALKYGFCGFFYYPILDDHIQYKIYRTLSFKEVFFDIGTIYTRPFAGILDKVLWSYTPLWLSLIIITALHFGSAVLIDYVLEKIGIRVSSLFYIFYLLFPLGSEATYWLSASSRIVVGIFVSSLACFVYLKGKRWLFALLLFISFGFYEQVMVFSFILSCFMYLKDRKFPIIPIIAAVLMVSYYYIFRNYGVFRWRTSESLKFSDVCKNVFYLFGTPTIEIIKNGFLKGIKLVSEKPLFFILILLSSATSFMHVKKGKATWLSILVGALLFLAPFLPFYVSGGGYVSLRGAFVPLIGIAIILGNINLRSIIPLLVFIFLIVNVTETFDYYNAGKADYEIIRSLAEMEGEVKVSPKTHKTTFRHNEHIQSITESDWALKGAMGAYLKDKNIERYRVDYDK